VRVHDAEFASPLPNKRGHRYAIARGPDLVPVDDAREPLMPRARNARRPTWKSADSAVREPAFSCTFVSHCEW
jgi:hypothetical protein